MTVGSDRRAPGRMQWALALVLSRLGVLLPTVEGAVPILGSPVVDFRLVAVCIAAIVLFTIVFEIGLEALEHKLEAHPLSEEMLQHVIKEVMILGLISFSLFMLEQFEVLNLSDEWHKKWVIGFEFSHILVFYMGVLFILKSAVVSVVCSLSSREWNKLNIETFEQTLDRFAPVEGGKRSVKRPGICTIIRGSCTRVMASYGHPAKQDLIWQLMSMEFNLRLKMTYHGFDFARYLRISVRKTVAHAMHITWQIWFICAATLVTIFAAWGYAMGCEDGKPYRRRLGGAEDASGEAVYQCDAVDVEATNTSCRRLLGSTGPKPKLDPDSASTAVLCFCLFGWVLTIVQLLIAWRMEVQEELKHFEALGLTETDENGKRKKLEGQELLDAVTLVHRDFQSKLDVLTYQDSSNGAYTMPEVASRTPTIMIFVTGLPTGLEEDLPRVLADVRGSFESALHPSKIVDVRIRLKPPAELLKSVDNGDNGDDTPFTPQLRVSEGSRRHIEAGLKTVQSWGIVTVYGDNSELKKAKSDPHMKAKGWWISRLDRSKLRSLNAELFLRQADNVNDNNVAKSEAVHAQGGHGHRHDDHSQSHGHDHAHGNGGFSIQTGIDSLMLLSCFYLALYLLFMYYAINTWSGWTVWSKIGMNILVVAPALINLGWYGPAALKAAAVVHGVQEIDEDSIKQVLRTMEVTIQARANLRDALRREYGIEQPHPERKIWRDRFKDHTRDLADLGEETIRFSPWFQQQSASFFHEVANATTEVELQQLMEFHDRKKHIRLEKDNDNMYFKYYPQTFCPTEHNDARSLDGMRDVLIADETARLILRTDFGLGEQGLVSASKDAIKAGGKSMKNTVGKNEGQTCRTETLYRFINGERLQAGRTGRRQWTSRNETGFIASELSMREVRWLMSSIDVDQSGELSRRELTLLLLGSERSLDDKKRQHLEQLRHQAAAALGRLAGFKQGVSVEEKSVKQRVADCHRVFCQADTDGSGEISWSELQFVLNKITGVTVPEEHVKQMIEAIDEDESGDIDFSEFLLLIAEWLKDSSLAEHAANSKERSRKTRQLWRNAVARSTAKLKSTDHVDGESRIAALPVDVEAGQEADTGPMRPVAESVLDRAGRELHATEPAREDISNP